MERGTMKVGIAGIASFYWPRAFASYARRIEGLQLCAAATAGRTAEQVQRSLGQSPEAFAAEFGLRLYDDPAQMVREEGLEAAFVCAEPSRAYELVQELAPLGVHLYIAKPMANTVERAQQIMSACQKAGIVAASGNTMRFDAALRAARQRIAAGQIGDIFCVRVMHEHGNINVFPPEDWYWHKEEGGPELSLGWYVVDAIRWLSGAEVVRVFAEYGNFASPRSPFMDNGKLLCRLSSRAIASADIYFSMSWSFPRWEIEVVGSKGAIKTMQTGYEAMLFSEHGVEAFQKTLNDMVLAEVQDWATACQQGGRPAVPVEDALRTLAVCLAARQAAETQQPVSL
jgi:predicted dehydrogenase